MEAGEREHMPVLASETLELLDPQAGETALDCTAGLGGHAALLAERVGASGRMILNDLDPWHLERAAARVRAAADAAVETLRGNFAEAPRKLAERGWSADVVLADLGFASSQVEDPERGLSLRLDGPLDMRLDPQGPLTAAELVNTGSEEELAEIIRDFGEERMARRVARKIVASRAERPIETTGRLASIVTPQRAARWRDEEPDDGLPTPAFLVGFPRSGTTMTERALDAHPSLRSLEEKPTLTATKTKMGQDLGLRDDPDDGGKVDAMTPAQVTELRRFYWARVADELGGPPRDGEVVLDKLPLRIIDLPVVNRLFPRASVIVALRDPRDVILSCFRQNFRINLPMSFFLDIHDSARCYEAVMGSWLEMRGVYSFDVKEVRYEDTVSDFEPKMREMLAFLGLDWDDAVLSFHERKPDERQSVTPSYHAVRRKVNRGAIGRWKPYAAQLAPILPTLEPFVEAFGYEPSSETVDAG